MVPAIVKYKMLKISICSVRCSLNSGSCLRAGNDRMPRVTYLQLGRRYLRIDSNVEIQCSFLHVFTKFWILDKGWDLPGAKEDLSPASDSTT